MRSLKYFPAFDGITFNDSQSMYWNGVWPNDDTCIFWEHCDYGGSSVTLSLNGGNYNEMNLKGHWINDKIGSYICGSKVLLYLCDDYVWDSCYNDRGGSSAAAKNRDLGSKVGGHGDRASSIKMWPYDPVNGTGGITVFGDKGCWDDNAYFSAGAPG